VAGQVASNVGDAAYAVALPWYVLAVHGGTALLGTVLVAYGIPRTGLLSVGGWASDRWGARTVMMASDTARCAAAAALAAVAALGPARAVLLIPVALVLGAGEGLFLPASYAVLPSVVPDDDLQAANGLTTSAAQLATLAGPAIGGALVALGSPSIAFALDAVSFAVSAATLARLRRVRPIPPAGEPTPAADGDGPRAAETEMSTFALFRSERVLQVILLLTITANLGSDGVDYVALPALAHGPLGSGASGYGLILAAFGAGALLGALVAGQIRPPRRPGVAGVLAFQAVAVCILVTPYLGSTLGVAGVMVVNGATVSFGNVLCFAAFQRWAPPALLGRATGVVTLGIFGVYPVSVALGAIFTRDLGITSFFIFSAVTLTAAVLFGLSQRAWRDFGLPAPRTGGSVPAAEGAGEALAPEAADGPLG
jgi:predicted MFS family arabinose efflux permease